MSDFDDLRQIRDAKERAEAATREKQLEEERQKIEAAQRLEEKKRANADGQNEMIREVLESLRDALYPDLKVRRLGLESWGIVRVGQNEYGGYEIDRAAVVVELEFNQNGEPRRLISHKDRYANGSKAMRSDLTRSDLVRALKKLHPADTIR